MDQLAGALATVGANGAAAEPSAPAAEPPAAPPPFRLTDAQAARIAVYIQERRAAVARENEAFLTLLIGRGDVDFARYVALLEEDGVTVRLTPRGG